MTGHESNRFSSFPHRAISARFAKLRSREMKPTTIGFTIVELLVVLVIIGLLSGMAVPKFLRADAEAKLEGDAQKVLLDFRLAKQAANKTNLRHWIVITPPRRLEVWRAKADTIYKYDTAKAERVFIDSLNVNAFFGFSDPAKFPYPTIAPPGFLNAPGSTRNFSGLGIANANGAQEDCVDDRAPGLTGPAGSVGWHTPGTPPYVVQVCGGPIADMATGIAYLSTKGSDNKLFAIGYSNASVQLRFWRWMAGDTVWEEL